MRYSEFAQIQDMAIDYYRLGIKYKLFNSELKRVEHILKVCESNNFLNHLIIEIDIKLAESQCSKKEFEEHCNKLREDTKKHMTEYFNQKSCNAINYL